MKIQNAFSLKTDSELERAYFLFRMIANEPLVQLGPLYQFCNQSPFTGRADSASVFDHFCGGVSEEDCLPVVDKMFSKESVRFLIIQ